VLLVVNSFSIIICGSKAMMTMGWLVVILFYFTKPTKLRAKMMRSATLFIIFVFLCCKVKEAKATTIKSFAFLVVSSFFVIVCGSRTSLTCCCPGFFFQTYRAKGQDDEECDVPCCLCFLCSENVEMRATTMKSAMLLVVNSFFVIVIFPSSKTTNLPKPLPRRTQLVIVLIFFSKPIELKKKTTSSSAPCCLCFFSS